MDTSSTWTTTSNSSTKNGRGWDSQWQRQSELRKSGLPPAAAGTGPHGKRKCGREGGSNNGSARSQSASVIPDQTETGEIRPVGNQPTKAGGPPPISQ